MAGSSANVALSREFPDVLVLLMLLWSTLGWLLAVSLQLLRAEARLLRLCYIVAVTPWLPPVARWITASWVRRTSSRRTLFGEVRIVIPLSPLSCLVHRHWVVDEYPVLCRWLEAGDVPVQRFGIRNVAALKQSCTKSRSIVHYGSRLLTLM